jgi:hypothetical protein
MISAWLYFLDIFFLVFHSLLIVFNLFGWIWRPLRKWNLLCLVLTGLSWFGLGIFYGIGYCPLTDWHWMVLYDMGERGLPASYVQYILDRLLSIQVTPRQADLMTVVSFFLALIISGILNWRDRYRKPA